jgi:hypothetical protein
LGPYQLIAVSAAIKRPSAPPKLAGVKKRLWKKQARAASTTGVAAKEAAGYLIARPATGWHTDDRTANRIAAQVSNPHRKFIATQQSLGLTPVAPLATSSRNLTIVANVTAEQMQL